MHNIIERFKTWRTNREIRRQNALKLAHYMETMTWMTQRLQRDRNARHWHKLPPRQTEFQKYVADYMAK